MSQSHKSNQHLNRIEEESIYIIREVAAEFERPVLLFSGGKDSICMLRIAEKAFYPRKLPFPLLHIDTGHNFPELLEFRDRKATELGAKLIVRTVEQALLDGIAKEIPGSSSRNRLQSPTLLAALKEFEFDAALGGARRDEEKARAKERIFSFRNPFGQWNPKQQRPELWEIYNTKVHKGEHMRIFPLSNWTEMDIWSYIDQEGIEVPSLYFSHQRPVFRKGNQWLAVGESSQPEDDQTPQSLNVRVRTIGDISCTGCIESKASSVSDIIREIATAKITERGGRWDDRFSQSAMEDRKREGYF